MEGRQMFMILAPNAKVAQRARDLARQQLAAIAASRKQHGHAPPAVKAAPAKPAQELSSDRPEAAAVPSGTE
jgi:translation initiation factor IF-3